MPGGAVTPTQAKRFIPDFALPNARGRFLAAVALLFLLLSLRRPDALLNAQFWAEDGAVFFTSQISYGFWTSAVTPYAGYFHLAPRLIVALASSLPAVWAPLVCNIFALLLAAICCTLFALAEYRYVLESDLQRFLVCVLLGSVSFCDELSGNITNLQWYLALAAVLIVFRKHNPTAPPGISSAILIGVAGAVIACTSPLPLVLLPFLVWKLLHYRSTERIWLALMTVGVAFQSVAILAYHTTAETGVNLNQIIVSIIVALVYHTLLCSIAGRGGAIWVSQHGLLGVVFVTLVFATLWLAWLYRGSDARTRRTVLAGLYLVFSSMGMAMLGRPATARAYASLVGMAGWRDERYSFLSTCIVILLVVLTIKTLWPSAHAAVGGVLVCAVFSGGLLGNFRIPAFADFNWSAQAVRIDLWRSAWTAGKAVQGTAIGIMPGGPWAVVLPSRLAAATQASPWEGCLVSTRGKPEAFLVQGGHRRHIQSLDCIHERGLRWPEDLLSISQSDLAKMPLGDPISQCSPSPGNPAPAASSALSAEKIAAKYEHQMVRRPGTTPEDSKVYVVMDGKKRWVLHAKWFQAHGYNWPDVHEIPASELDAIPTGPSIEDK